MYPNSMKSHMKNNPLYTDLRLTEVLEQKQPQPSWVIEEYNRTSDKVALTALEILVKSGVSVFILLLCFNLPLNSSEVRLKRRQPAED